MSPPFREPGIFESLFEEIPAALALLRGPDFVFEAANEDYYKLIGRRDILGQPLVKALPEIADQPFPAILRKVYETGESFHAREVEVKLLADGHLKTFFLDFTYRRLKGGVSGEHGIFVFAVDVTEKVRVRNEVQNERAKLASVFENSSASLAILHGPELVYENANSAYHGLFQGRELIGRPLLEALPELRGQKFPDLLSRVYETGEPYREKEARALLRRTSEGPLEERFFDQSYTRVEDATGGTYGVLVHAIDVTERVRAERALRGSEQRWRLMADAMPQVVWTATPEGQLDYINERWKQYSGSSDPSQWLSLMHPEDVASAVEAFQYSLRTGENYETECRLRRSDGTYRWFLARAQASRDLEGRIERWFGTSTDIEDQKAAVAARNEFMSIASHELKTPLTSLKLQTQSMRRNHERGRADAYSPEKVGQLVATNEKQVDRLIRLVDEMLDFAKIEAGKLSMHREHVDISSLAHEVYERLAEQLSAAGCEATLEVEPGVGAYVDQFRIEQVITNLLTNATRYGKGMPVQVRLRRAGNTAVLSVSDRGIGIAPEFRERIFNRFERGVSSSQVSGLGLGLFISREIVQAHGGRIWVESDLGKGSTFHVEMPIEAEDPR